MIIGYNVFLRKVATAVDSESNFTVSTLATKLNLRQDEFRNILNIMEKKGDLECITEMLNELGEKSSVSSGDCVRTFKKRKIKSYKLTEKGRKAFESLPDNSVIVFY